MKDKNNDKKNEDKEKVKDNTAHNIVCTSVGNSFEQSPKSVSNNFVDTRNWGKTWAEIGMGF